MIIENQQDVTTAVLAELQRAPDAGFREIMSALVRHLHDFVREAKLTEEEFHAALAHVVALGKHSTESHNEAVLMAGSLGLSALVCLINNGDDGRPRPTRTCSDRSGACTRRSRRTAARSCARRRRVLRCSSMPGSATARACRSRRRSRHLALLARRLLREPGPGQADMNLRGKFLTDRRAISASAG